MTNKDSFYPEEFYTDDRGTARVNSGEAVLTAAQQRNLWLSQIKHSCDDNYSNDIHEAEDFIGGKI